MTTADASGRVQPQHDRLELVVHIPELAEDVVAGSGCCFVSLDYLVREELLGWFGVEEVDLEPRGRVRITVRADRHPEVEDLVDALLDLGPSDVRREDAGGFIPRI